MSMKKVSLQLHEGAKAGANDIYRFERIERYVIQKVLLAAEHNQPIDDVFIECAKKILQHRPEDKDVAA
jgi:hypothetical protein